MYRITHTKCGEIFKIEFPLQIQILCFHKVEKKKKFKKIIFSLKEQDKYLHISGYKLYIYFATK